MLSSSPPHRKQIRFPRPSQRGHFSTITPFPAHVGHDTVLLSLQSAHGSLAAPAGPPSAEMAEQKTRARTSVERDGMAVGLRRSPGRSRVAQEASRHDRRPQYRTAAGCEPLDDY